MKNIFSPRPTIFATALALAFICKALCADSDRGPDAEQLSFFVGRWNCAGHFIASGAEIKSTLTFAWDESTKTLTVHHDDLLPNKYHALELWGASQATKELRNSIGDGYSGIRWFSSPGFAGETLAWTRSDKDVPVERFSYTRKNATQMTVEWWIARTAGTLVLGDTLDCERAT